MVRYVLYIHNGVFLFAKHVKVYQTQRLQVCLKKGMDYPDIPILRDRIGSLNPILAIGRSLDS